MANKMNSTKVVTGVVRLSYANVWEPASINGSNPKYSVSLIIPKSDKQTLDAINAAVDAAIKEGVAKFGGKIPNKAALKLPLRDGDTERDDEAYKNSFFVNANSTTAPQIVDRSVQPILDRSEVYSGCYAMTSPMFRCCRFRRRAALRNSFSRSFFPEIHALRAGRTTRTQRRFPSRSRKASELVSAARKAPCSRNGTANLSGTTLR